MEAATMADAGGREPGATRDRGESEVKLYEKAIIDPGHTFGSVTDRISSIVLKQKTRLGWYLGFAIAFGLLQLLLLSLTMLLAKGVGLWGINVPVSWGFANLTSGWLPKCRICRGKRCSTTPPSITYRLVLPN